MFLCQRMDSKHELTPPHLLCRTGNVMFVNCARQRTFQTHVDVAAERSATSASCVMTQRAPSDLVSETHAHTYTNARCKGDAHTWTQTRKHATRFCKRGRPRQQLETRPHSLSSPSSFPPLAPPALPHPHPHPHFHTHTHIHTHTHKHTPTHTHTLTATPTPTPTPSPPPPSPHPHPHPCLCMKISNARIPVPNLQLSKRQRAKLLLQGINE